MSYDITIAGGNFSAVPSIVVPQQGGGNAQFYSMNALMDFLGAGAEVYKDNFYLNEFTLYDTLFNGWTPSTTAKDIVASVTAGTFAATDLDAYDYYIVCYMD